MSYVHIGNAPSGSLDSPCGMLRYVQWAKWNWDHKNYPCLTIIGLHPYSAALNNPAMKVYSDKSKSLGGGSVIILNLFALKARSRHMLKCLGYPFERDPLNDATLESALRALNKNSWVMRAWSDPSPRDLIVRRRIQSVERILRETGQ